MAEEQQQATLGQVIIAIIFIIFIGRGCINAINSDSTTSSTPTQQTQTAQTQQQAANHQAEIQKIEGYIREFQKAGIFKKVTDMGSDDYGKMLEIQVDEYAWNNLDYDTKKAAENMFLQYWQIGHVTVLFKGYRTGQKLYTISKNFKI